MFPIDRRAADIKQASINQLMATASKHWVRMHAWLPVAQKRAATVSRKLKYFTLTTADLFDVKVLEREGLLEKTARGYPGLGFCEMLDNTYVEILRKVRWCGWHYKGIFEDMVSIPNFEDEFDFDVVNLDFTGVPFPQHEAPLEGTWGAIQRSVDVQWKHRRSFDLFLTLRGSREETDESALKQVADLVDYNLKNSRGKDEFKARIGHCNSKKLLDENYAEFLCVGIPKLLTSYALVVGYHLTHFEVYCYLREGEHGKYHIVKFILSFDVPQPQGSIFAQPPALVTSYDEAVPIIFSKGTFDVDELLQKNSGLTDELKKDIIALGSYPVYA